MQWIATQLIPQINKGNTLSKPGQLELDDAAFHRTEAVLKKRSDNDIIPSLILGGCTSLIQVLDASVNGSFKDYLKDAMDNELYKLGKTKCGLKHFQALDNDNDCEDNLAIDGKISAVRLRRVLLS